MFSAWIGFAAAGAVLLVLSLLGDVVPILLPAATLAIAASIRFSHGIAIYLRIVLGLIAGAHALLGGLYLAELQGLLPEVMTNFTPPLAMPVAAAVFAAAMLAVGRIPVIRTIATLTDPFFVSREPGVVHVWPFPEFRAQERVIGIGLLVVVVTMQFALVAIAVRLSYWNRDWFNAIQDRNSDEFWRLLLTVWVFWVVIAVTMAIYQYALRATLDIHWRAWMTRFYTRRWIDGSVPYRMQVFGEGSDNPDQRVQEDIDKFTSNTIMLTLGVLSQVSTLVSFSVILWTISSDFTFPGTEVVVPGLLFWIALVYAVIATYFTHMIGRPLIRLNFLQERFEADFRFSLARLREYGEQVALLRGQDAERERLRGQFTRIVENFFQRVSVNKRLIAFTSFYDYSNSVVPYVIAAPFYFAGKIQLGVMTQTAGAFARVETALSFFVNAYQALASYKAVVDRLTSFDEAIVRARDAGRDTGEIARIEHGDESIRLENLTVRLPDGAPIVAASSLVFEPGVSTLLAGPSGTGKSTLFRAISGIWPFGSGVVKLPAGRNVMLLPQRPYIPVGTLRGAVSYPSRQDIYSDEALVSALVAAKLGHLAGMLDEDRVWAQTLSLGEQQRLAIARALLEKPDWLLVDEATAAMDEPTEAEIYQVMREKLPDTTLISIGHRSTLAAFHDRRVVMVESAPGLYEPRMPEPAAAAQ
ncbi:MAG: ABC transporter ATP-binding protein/permease [Salinarimonadaceae bacterium]|nr:MAG: ABC transporter ATP-binding protein/permease [Salinarimonadaceae bacterium]